MQSNTHLDAPPETDSQSDEGVLFVDFEIEGTELAALTSWCSNTVTWYGTPCALLCTPGVDYLSPLQVTVVLSLSPSMTAMSATVLTSRILRSLRHSLKRSETWRVTANWLLPLELHQKAPTNPAS